MRTDEDGAAGPRDPGRPSLPTRPGPPPAPSTTARPEPPLVLHPDRRTNITSALGCTLAVGASLWMLLHADAGAFWNLVLACFVAAFGIAAIALVRRVLDRRPAIVVDDWGIRDRRTGVEAPWVDVREIRAWRQELRTTHVDWIALDVADPAKVRPGALHQSRALRAIASAMGAPPVLLDTADLPMPHDELLAELRRRHALRGARSVG